MPLCLQSPLEPCNHFLGEGYLAQEKGNRVRARVRGRVRFRNDPEVGVVVFARSGNPQRSPRRIRLRVLCGLLCIPANLAPRQSSNPFRFRIVLELVLVLVLGLLPSHRLWGLALRMCPNLRYKAGRLIYFILLNSPKSA
jgi:hypothetical protein